LLCNVALHGLETALTSVSARFRIAVIRYADDLVRHEARYVHDARASAAGRRAASPSP
jgi:hypothetical protein